MSAGVCRSDKHDALLRCFQGILPLWHRAAGSCIRLLGEAVADHPEVGLVSRETNAQHTRLLSQRNA